MASKTDDFIEPEYMSRDDIKKWTAYTDFPKWGDFTKPLIDRLKSTGEYKKNQAAGRRWAIGCVSLEVTQRCNLDCTLCYLSDMSEAVKDVPLQELFRRIDVIFRHYGPGTDIQISGGDPTLRKKDDLIAIIKRIRGLGMECSLFTNGILAKREFLTDLAEAGLTDVAFHVDLTQERKGYETEEDLNELRLKYIDRAKGLGINIFFNTTVYEGNFKQVPKLVEFFKDNADSIDLVSFQIQAEQGRGVLRGKEFYITQDSVIEQLEKGTGTEIVFDMPLIGHPKCNKKAVMFKVGDKMINMADKDGFVEEMVTLAPPIQRAKPLATISSMLGAVAKRPRLWGKAAKYTANMVKQAAPQMIGKKPKVEKLTFFIHNFMDACKLEKDRIDSCVFMVASTDGPVSMCMHNAKRDDFILKPFKVDEKKDKFFDPLKGEVDSIDQKIELDATALPKKHQKGRVRAKSKTVKKPSKKPESQPSA